jgi:hypothetical protein
MHSIRRACSALLLVVSASFTANAQDTARVVADSADTLMLERKPPISARRAFISSAILPGYGQSALGRKRSGAMMLAVEALTVAMIRSTAISVREARRNAVDSVIVSYVDANGVPKVTYARDFPTGLIKARREQVEDWIAVLIGNHLFSAVDALVAAILWDLPAEVAVSGDGRRTTSLGLRVRF